MAGAKGAGAVPVAESAEEVDPADELTRVKAELAALRAQVGSGRD